MYEVNANGNRSFSSPTAQSVASVAVAWRKQGHEPKAFAIGERDGKVTVASVEISSVRATASALTLAMPRPYEARMHGIGYSSHSTEAAAKRALAKFRREYRETRNSMPYPQQTITVDGRAIYTA